MNTWIMYMYCFMYTQSIIRYSDFLVGVIDVGLTAIMWYCTVANEMLLALL